MTNEEAFQKWWMTPGESFGDEEEIAREAWAMGRLQALNEAYDAMFAIKGDKVTRFDAQTAIRNLKGVAP